MKRTDRFLPALLSAVLLLTMLCSCAGQTNQPASDLPTDTGTDTVTDDGTTADSDTADVPAETTDPSGDSSDTTDPSGQPGTDSTPESTAPPVTTRTPVPPVTTAPPAHTHEYVCTAYTPANCLSDGSATYTCSCGASYTEVLPKTGHQFEPATCTTPKTCKNCGLTHGDPLPHEVVNGVCSRCGRRPFELGISAATLEAIFGAPTERLQETTSSGPVTTYVYAADLRNLKIFQVSGGVVFGAFVTGTNIIFSYGGVNVTPAPSYENGSLKSMELISNSQFEIYTLSDTVGSLDVSGAWAKLSSVPYGFDTITRTTVFGGGRITDFSVQGKLCWYLSNHYRAINGLSALAYDNRAAMASLVHSYDMAVNNYFAHPDANGLRAGERLTAEGVSWAGCGENIQAGFLNVDGARTTNIFFITHGWYVSPDHRENLLLPDYRFMGAASAYADGSSYLFYSTQVFFR